MRHIGCITDPLTKAYWRDYQRMCKEGNPLGLSFVEYVTQRTFAAHGPNVTGADASPWYVSACGHKHPWGESCAAVTLT